MKQNDRRIAFKNLLEAINKIKKGRQSVCLFPHIGADGDALGSSIAMLRIFNKLEIEACVCLEENLPEKFIYLTDEVIIKQIVVGVDDCKKYITGDPVAFVLDCHGQNRLGKRELYAESMEMILVVDHHPSDRKEHPCFYKDIKAAATCEIIGYFIQFLEKEMNRSLIDVQIATAILTGLMTDTGRFSYSNTTSSCLRMAADMLQYEVDIRFLTLKLFDTTSKARIELMRRLFERMKFYADGKIIVSYIARKDMIDVRAKNTDLDGLCNQLKEIEGVEVALMIREVARNFLRGNLRSSKLFNSSIFATTLGGGGHVQAAGFTLDCTLDEAVLNMPQKMIDFMNMNGDE